MLAAAQPLSLQAHPSRSQAEDGFAREQAAGIPISAPERNYKDRSPKPELLVALTPFFALSGFRHPATTAELLRALEVPELEPTLARLAEPEPSRALSDTFSSLMTLGPSERSALAVKTLEGAKRKAETASPFQKEFGWAVRLGALYPGDIGIVGALLLELVGKGLEASGGKAGFFGAPELEFGTAMIALAVLILAGLLASLMPAAKAAAVNPIIALQDE